MILVPVLVLRTCTLAPVLLLSIAYSVWVTLLFPGWVFAVSVSILVRNLRDQPGVLTGEMKRWFPMFQAINDFSLRDTRIPNPLFTLSL
jgi:hypothetical protein